MTKYHYRVLKFTPSGRALTEFQKQLNEYGAEGWKVVGTGGSGGVSEYESFSKCWVILMREK